MVTDYRAPAYYEARELRQQGLSGKQIAEQLGVSLKTVYDWVSDIELTAEQQRALKSRKAMRKSSAPSTIAVREEAKQLRQQGLSVKAIAKQLDVAQSSVSIWVRAIELTPEMQARIRENGQRHIAEAERLANGDPAAREFIQKYLEPEIEMAAAGELGGNFKSLLQQLAQREHGTTPTYQLLDEKGPDHSKCFKVAAQISRQRYSPAWGRNKKEAEQRAARNALSELNGEPVPFPSD